MWVSLSPAAVRCSTKKLLCSSSSPKPKFLSASPWLLDSDPLDPPESVAAAVSRLKHHPDLAFSLFGHLDSRHFLFYHFDPPTYASLISILSRSRLGFVFSRLMLSVRERSAIRSLLDSLALQGGPSLLVRCVDLVVKNYVGAGRSDDAIHILLAFKRDAGVSTCNFLLDRLIENGNPAAAITLYQQLHFSPNDRTYAVLIKAVCNTEGRPTFHDMAWAGLIPKSAFTIYLKGLCTNGRSCLAYEALVYCRDSRMISLSHHAYAAVLCGLCAEMKLDEAEKVLSDMEDRGVVPDVRCYAALFQFVASIGYRG